jgi:predicted amidohydrolase YtcJ
MPIIAASSACDSVMTPASTAEVVAVRGGKIVAVGRVRHAQAR